MTGRCNEHICSCFVSAYERSDQHLHDPDRGAGEPSERPRHTHETDQSLHTCRGELHREIPTMHHGRLHDVPHHPMTETPADKSLKSGGVLALCH